MIKITNKISRNRGMTYVELIIVLSIFAIMSSVSLVSYRSFQSKVEIRNLATDIALQIVQAQKDAMSGKQTSLSFYEGKRPAYGVYFAPDNNDDGPIAYFADRNNNQLFESNEVIQTLSLNKSTISAMSKNGSSCNNSSLTISFMRPDSKAFFACNNVTPTSLGEASITVSSTNGENEAIITVTSLGKISIN